jgi:hypothetical protein
LVADVDLGPAGARVGAVFDEAVEMFGEFDEARGVGGKTVDGKGEAVGFGKALAKELPFDAHEEDLLGVQAAKAAGGDIELVTDFPAFFVHGIWYTRIMPKTVGADEKPENRRRSGG